MTAPAHFYADTYGDAALADLCDRLGAGSDRKDELKAALEDHAAIWRWSRAARPSPQRAEARRALRDLAKQADRMRAALDALPPEARNAIERQVAAHGQRAAVDGTSAPQAASLMLDVDITGTGASFVSIDPPVLAALVGGMAQAARDEAEMIQPAPAGRRRDHALRLWMENAADVWEGFSGQPFTRDVSDAGEPISPAARFTVAAFRPLDPDKPVSEIMQGMKLCIQRRRRKTGRNTAQDRA